MRAEAELFASLVGAVPAPDMRLIAESNNRLHRLILDAGKNKRLASMLVAVVHIPLVKQTFGRYSAASLARSAAQHLDLVAAIESRPGMKFLVHPELDIRNDIEGVAALGLACSLVMSTGVSTREICAAAGANVYSISFGWPWANAWRRDDGMRDTIFPSMMHCDPASRHEVLEQAIERARAELRR